MAKIRFTLPLDASARALVMQLVGQGARDGRVPLPWRGRFCGVGSATWPSASWEMRGGVSHRCRLRRPVSVGQRIRVGRGEVEGRGQVAEDGTAIGADLGLRHAEAGFEEAQHGRVVELLRIHPAPTAPGRNHIHGNARAGAIAIAVGRGHRRVRHHAMRVVLVGHIGGAQRRLAEGGARCHVQRGRARRRHVVEVAVVFIEVDQQHRLDQTSGLAVSASSTSCTYQPPWTGLDGPGCSE